MRDVVLTGFMGTGKTTVGKILAERYGLSFVDTDAEVEARAGTSISQLMANSGEPAFRALEREVVASLGAGSGRVIATGGGALLSAANRALLTDEQPVVCLTADPEELYRRLEGADGRPLLNPVSAERIRALLGGREEAYSVFEQIDTSGKQPEAIADEIADRFGLDETAHIHFERTTESTIFVARDLLDQAGQKLGALGLGGDVLLVTDTNVERHGLAERVVRSLHSQGIHVTCVALEPGEEQKRLEVLAMLYSAALDAGLDRAGTVLALGGGVIGDLAGFMAATYMRGVRLALAPTTLLAQVDAAIGGKVAVDCGGVKNLVGAFYPADLVLIDPSALHTLPEDQISAGMAEVVKIALVRSQELLSELEQLPSPAGILENTHIIRRAAQEKAMLVQSDPFERGDRMLLNFGHTVGHAVEAASRFQLSHGEAVAIGMEAELRVAVESGWSDASLRPVLRELLRRMALPLTGNGLDASEVRSLMDGDKKRSRGRIRFAVPVRRGEGDVVEVTEEQASLAVAYALGHAQ